MIKINRYMTVYLLLLFMLVRGATLHAHDVIVYTENYPPFNYLNDQGGVDGLATEKVKQVLDTAGLSYDIRMVPWSRAMQQVQSQPNALIYTITRTPERERKFHWLVPFAPSNFHIFMRADDNRTVTEEALRAGKFTGSCVSTDLTCELLRELGLPKDKIFPISKQVIGDFLMVSAGRADIYIGELAANSYLRIMHNHDPAVTKPVMKLNIETGFYLAGGLILDVALRERIRTAYGTLLDSGEYKMLDFTPKE